MTDPRDARILELRRAGHSVKTIAAMVRAGKSTVEASLARQGETARLRVSMTAAEKDTARRLESEGLSIRAICREMGRSQQAVMQALGIKPKPRPAGWGEKQSEAACVAHREGGDRSPPTVPALAPIPSDPIAASLWMRGIRHTGEALHQARLKPVRNEGDREVAASPSRVVRPSKAPFRIGLHALSIGATDP